MRARRSQTKKLNLTVILQFAHEVDKLVRKIEIPMAKKAIEKAGLYIVKKEDLDRLAEVAADAYRDYPLHNWFTKGKYDAKASELLMKAMNSMRL